MSETISLIPNDIILDLASSLAIQLPDGRDRIVANKWLSKFNSASEEIKNQYLSIFVYCLQQKILVEPFKLAPADQTSQWPNFDKEYSMDEIRTSISIAKAYEILIPPYKIDMSQDMKEFAAYQEIPNFGAHFYFAISSDPITEWDNFSKLKIPRELVPSLIVDQEIRESPAMNMPKVDPRARAPILAKSRPRKNSLKPDWEPLIAPEPEPEKPCRQGFLRLNFYELQRNKPKMPLHLQKRIVETSRRYAVVREQRNLRRAALDRARKSKLKSKVLKRKAK